jgi:hypothetical protein
LVGNRVGVNAGPGFRLWREDFYDAITQLNFLPLLCVAKIARNGAIPMKTEAMSDAALEKADEEAVMKHFLHGAPIDPAVSARVHARAQAITDRLRAIHGVINEDTIQSLLNEDE